MEFKVNVEITDWRTLNLHTPDAVEDELQALLEIVGRVVDQEEYDLILGQIDCMHHYLERTYGRNYHTLTAFLSNYEYVYESLHNQPWRLSYLWNEVPYNVNNVIKTEKQSDGSEVLYTVFEDGSDTSSPSTEGK